MDPATLLQMILSGVGMFSKFGAQQDAYNSQKSQVANQNKLSLDAYRQKQDAYNKSLDFAQQPTMDPYGNSYIPGFGYTLSDNSARTLSAEQDEMLKNLTEDANRNREYRRRMETGSIAAGNEYNRELSDYKYGSDKPDLGQYKDDYTRIGLIGRGKGQDEAKSLIARQLLRANEKGSLIDSILKKADDLFGQSLEETMLKGRMTGEQAYQGARNSRDSDFFNKLNFFNTAAHNQPQANISKSGLYGNLDASADAANSNILSTLRSAPSIIGNGPNLSTFTGVAPTMDFSSISSLLPKLLASKPNNDLNMSGFSEPIPDYEDPLSRYKTALK